MRKLVKFELYIPRSSKLQNIFVADKNDWEVINKSIEDKIDLRLGEVAGKYSEVYYQPTIKDFTVVTEDEKLIDFFISLFPYGLGNIDILGRIDNHYSEVFDDE